MNKDRIRRIKLRHGYSYDSLAYEVATLENAVFLLLALTNVLFAVGAGAILTLKADAQRIVQSSLVEDVK